MGTQARRLAGKLPGALGHLMGLQALTRPNNRDRTGQSHKDAELRGADKGKGKGT